MIKEFIKKIVKCFELPEVKKINHLDDPATTLLHTKIIRHKPFLKKLYTDFYVSFRDSLPPNYKSENLVELGSGGGFIKEIIPNVVTSDIIKLPGIDMQFSALKMPLRNNSVDAFFMVDVFHHLPNVKKFLSETERCLRVGGKIYLIDPANTLWGRFIYKNFHHESFNEKTGWFLRKGGPLSSANGALAWIVFCRDRKKLEKEFPKLKIKKIEFHTPFLYLLSGGVSFKQFLPPWSYNIIKIIEVILSPLNKYLGMFMTIEIEKIA